MSSHREAPEISKDPVADSTDTYAFVSPDRPDTVTIITNYIPLEDPAGGPNFFEFGDDVLYRINVDNTGDGRADITYEFKFKTVVQEPEHVPLQHRPDRLARQPQLQPPAVLHRHRGSQGQADEDARQEPGVAAVQHRPAVDTRTTPTLANSAIYALDDGIKVFAGQRLDGFYVDLGSVFDLAALRPFQNLHLISTPAAPGIDALRSFNVHTIAIQVPISRLTREWQVADRSVEPPTP